MQDLSAAAPSTGHRCKPKVRPGSVQRRRLTDFRARWTGLSPLKYEVIGMGLLQQLRDSDLVVAGAGLFGLTIAERAAHQLGLRVLLIERRNHPGGNAWSEVDPDTGIEVHRYGSHIFHCSDDEVWHYVTRFSGFTNYRHRVMTTVQGQVYPLPINLGTICSFFRCALSPAAARALIRQQAGEFALGTPSNLEEQAIRLIGRPLYPGLRSRLYRQAMAD